MCQCTPAIRTPFCGRGDCQSPPRRIPSVRLATLEDEPAMVRMGVRFLAEGPYPNVAPNPAQVSAVVGTVIRQGFAAIAETDAIVGMLLGWSTPNPITGLVTVAEVAWWMEPEHRGSRAAVVLFQAFETWARTRDAGAIHMIAPAGSTVGHFYERQGYRPLETIWEKRVTA